MLEYFSRSEKSQVTSEFLFIVAGAILAVVIVTLLVKNVFLEGIGEQEQFVNQTINQTT